MIRAAPPVLDAIRDHAAQAWPEECCGLLVGTRDAAETGAVQIETAVACRNVAAEPRRAFEVEPQVRIDLERRLRGTGRAVVGHYHSHPDGPASPSASDHAQAFEPQLVWLICGATESGVDALAGFRLNEASRKLEPVAVVETAPAEPGDTPPGDTGQNSI